MRAVSLFVAVLAAGCGAKTGLTIPDASIGHDAGMDAGMDSGVCAPRPVALMRRGAQVMFVIDRSNSMRDTIDGRDPALTGLPSRWTLVHDALADVLGDSDPLLEIGGKFYPAFILDPGTPEEACMVETGIDLAPARGNVPGLLAVFTETGPAGGTPTAMALTEVRDFFARRPVNLPRFVILATDGGPNCNPDTGVPHTSCLCTGPPDFCTDPEGSGFGPYNCIDDIRTVEVVSDLFTGAEIPVYVIGILDPTRPDLADVLDQMAVAGGRPREVAGERSFYDINEPDELRGALATITESISRCVFNVAPVPVTGDLVSVRIDGVTIPRDTGRVDGWDFTTSDRNELTLFGGSCARLAATGGEVVAEIECPAE